MTNDSERSSVLSAATTATAQAGYVLHMLDEFILHGAEISLLRDLYRWQKPISTDALTERAIRGDHSLLVDIESRAGGGRPRSVFEQLWDWDCLRLPSCASYRAWFDACVDVVVTHGAVFESDGFEILRRAQPLDVAVHHILLCVDPEVAVTRVRDDPKRGISRTQPSSGLRTSDYEHSTTRSRP